MADGWCCPKCGKCYAPWVAECSACNAQPVTATRITVRCTCGDGLTSGCPLHPPFEFHTTVGRTA